MLTQLAARLQKEYPRLDVRADDSLIEVHLPAVDGTVIPLVVLAREDASVANRLIREALIEYT